MNQPKIKPPIRSLTFLLTVPLALGLLLSNSFAQPSDPQIDEWVRGALSNLPFPSAPNITAKVEEGIVSLNGQVETIAAKEHAVAQTQKVDGVIGVVDQITVKPVRREEANIISDVRRRLMNSAIIRSQTIQVACDDQIVHLSGQADSLLERREALTLAKQVRGVREVQSTIEVSQLKPLDDAQIQTNAEAMLERDVYLTGLPIKVSVDSRVATLSGFVGSPYEKKKAGEIVYWLEGVSEVVNNIEVVYIEERGERAEAPIVTDGAVKKTIEAALFLDGRVGHRNITVAVNQGLVTLSGAVPHLYHKKIAGEDAQNTVGVIWLTNELVVVSRREDSALQADVTFNLDTDVALARFQIDVQVERGLVTLGGTVHRAYQKRHAREVAERVFGVLGVESNIEVQFAVEHADMTIGKRVESRLSRNVITNPINEEITVEVVEGVATLKGAVDTFKQRHEAENVARSTSGVLRVVNELRVNNLQYPWGDFFTS
ncbi:MAG: osmotically-inducible protein OsmY [Verrucomicrobiales bacterium]|jgi:osmotically-inducible protein OsmY